MMHFFFPLPSNMKIDTPLMKDEVVHLNVFLQHPLENKMNIYIVFILLTINQFLVVIQCFGFGEKVSLL